MSTASTAASPVERIDYATWRTQFGADLRAGAGTNHVEIAKVCEKLSQDGEAILTAAAADALAVALIEAAALARGVSIADASNVVAELSTLVRQRKETQAGGPAAVADPGAVKSLDAAISAAAKEQAEAQRQAEAAGAAAPDPASQSTAVVPGIRS